MRALYQRSKGRDLFDLWFALAHGTVDTRALFRSFQRYMAKGGHRLPARSLSGTSTRRREAADSDGTSNRC